MVSSKQKIDKVLGIKPEQNVDDFLKDLSLDVDQLSSAFGDVAQEVKSELASVDEKISQLKESSDPNASQLIMKDMNSSMKEVEELIDVSKQMFKHIYSGIVSTDLIDSELVGAAAKMLESIHINIKEFIDMYKERQRYVDKVKLMVFQQEQRKEMEMLKHKLAMERLKMKADEGAVDAEAGMVSYNITDIVKSLDQHERSGKIQMTTDFESDL